MRSQSFLVILFGCLAQLTGMVTLVSGAFNHPGVLLDRAQLEFIRLNVKLGLDPWKSAYKSMMNSSLAALDRPATPFVNVECGSNSVPDIGCKAERQDALASYAMSLAWYITKNQTYADKAISYFNAWSYTLQSHNNSNAPLQSGWSGASWTRAAEIIRHTNNGGCYHLSESSYSPKRRLECD